MKIFVCPLDWGLGHATRCVPLIRQLQKLGHQVILGADGRSRVFLKREFPDLQCLKFPGYKIRYPDSKWFALLFITRIPGILKSVYREHLQIRKLIGQHNFQLVISDNRYGLFSEVCPCVIVTHQLVIKCPEWRLAGINLGRISERLVSALVQFFLKKFDQVWVPDYPAENNLSGELSHGCHDLKNLEYINPLSRFPFIKEADMAALSGNRIDYLALISGPEPQRTEFEAKVMAQFQELSGARAVVLGMPEHLDDREDEGPLKNQEKALRVYSHLDGKQLEVLIKGAGCIIARSGYSTLMELHALQKKKILLVPTPGQTEQMYLARYMQSLGVAPWQLQASMNLQRLREYFHLYGGFENECDLEERLSLFLSGNALLGGGEA